MQYHHVEDIALGHYWHSRFENRTIYPINLCEKRYELAKPNAKASDIDYNADTVTGRQLLIKLKFIKLNNSYLLVKDPTKWFK